MAWGETESEQASAKLELAIGDLAWQGIDRAVIAQRLGVPVKTVYRVMEAMGFPVRPRAHKKRPQPTGGRTLAPCGTYAAYMRHKYHNETPCAPCVEAFRDYQRAQHALYRRRKGITPIRLAPCGTPGAYYRHIRRNETPCEPCRGAVRRTLTPDHCPGSRQPTLAASERVQCPVCGRYFTTASDGTVRAHNARTSRWAA